VGIIAKIQFNIEKEYLIKSIDGEGVRAMDPDREFPGGERGGETCSEYISGAAG